MSVPVFLLALGPKPGHPLATTRDAGKVGQAIPDDEVLRHAAENGRAVPTPDRRHFVARHNPADPRHAGVVVRAPDADFPGQAARIHEALTAAGEPAGRLTGIDRPPR